MSTSVIPFRAILNDLFEGVICLDSHQRVTYWNSTAEEITGYRGWEVLGRVCSEKLIKHIDKQGNPLCETDSCPFKEARKKGAMCQGEYYLQNRHGEIIPIVCRTKPLHDKRGRSLGVVSTFLETPLPGNVQKRLEELERLTLLDPLTEVGNRRFAELHLNSFMESWKRYGHRFGMLFIDIDHFKHVNDRYGHKTGDKVLRMVALVIKYSMRSFDVVARWGGEEFVALVYDVTEEQLSDIAERTRKLIGHAHVLHKGAPVKVTASIGITIVDEGDTLDSIVTRADTAMYQSKKGGRNRVTGTLSPLP